MRSLIPIVLLSVLPSVQTFAQSPEYILEQVVSLTRHGVRPQTDTQELNQVTGKQWPTWQVPDGYLTDHGYQGMVMQAQYLAKQWQQQGLKLSGCPDAQEVFIWSSPVERTQKTADAISQGLVDGCKIPTGSTKYEKDPLFSAIKMSGTQNNFEPIRAEFEKRLGSSEQVVKKYQANIKFLKDTVCAPDACKFLDKPWNLVANKEGQPKLKGPVENGSNIGETVRLQYSEGLPLSQVAFGHVKNVKDVKDVKEFMMLHQAKYHYVNEIPQLAQQGGSILMNEMLDTLNSPRPVTLFIGHDTNISQIQTMLGFNWQLPEYPANDIPPGGTLAFEKYKQVKTGKEFVRISFSARTLDQWRNLTPLSANNPLPSQDLSYHYCKKTNVGVLCPLDQFVKNTRANVLPNTLEQPLFQ